jgi:hypothetical protein
MSRGFGKIQTRLLSILRAHAATAPRGGLDTIELADRIYYTGPPPKFHKRAKPKHEVAVRRALTGLAKKRLVSRLGMRPSEPYRIRRCHWRAR